MFCAVEEDKMISGTEHIITETNKTKFQHTSGCHGLQTGRQPIVSLYSTNVLVVPRVISLGIQFSVKHYMKRDHFARSKREITVRIKSNWQMCILAIECKSV